MARPNLTLVPRPAPGQTLTAAIDAFLLDKQAGNRTPKTIAYYRFELCRFAEYARAAGVSTLPAVTADLVRRYVVAMQERKLKGTSQHAAMRAVRAFLNWCVRQEFISASPLTGKVTMPKRELDKLPALTVDDVAALLAVATTSRDRAIILCLLDSGCRAAEFCALNMGDVDRKSGAVQVRLGKGRKSREVYFGPKARAALARYLYTRTHTPADAPLWVSTRSNTTDGERLTVSGLQQVLKRLGAAAGVHVSPHALRRTCALLCHRAGWRITEIQQLLGHSDLTVLQRYLNLDREDTAAAHTRYSPSSSV